LCINIYYNNNNCVYQNALSQQNEEIDDTVITAAIENMLMTLFEFKGEFDRDPRNVWASVCNKFIQEWFEG